MKLLKIFSRENFRFRKLQKSFQSPITQYKIGFKKTKLVNNIIWSSRFEFNFVEFIIKKIIWFILHITMLREFLNNSKKANEMINRIYKKFISKNFYFIYISTSFYFLVSFVPIVIFVYFFLWLISFNTYNFKDFFIESILARIIPNISRTIQEFKENNTGTGGAWIVLLLLSTLWISSSGYSNFITAQNHIYNHKNSVVSKITYRIKGFFAVFGIGLYISFFVIITFLIASAAKLLITENEIKVLNHSLLATVFFVVMLFIFLYFGIFALLRFTPSFAIKWRQINSGIVVSCIPIWILISMFGWISYKFINYNKYGSLGIFMYLSLFVSLLSYFLFLGIIVNESYYKLFVSQRTFPKRRKFKF
ncbi:hypothetical protein BLA55_02750 [Mycoplasmopsis pullorum]|uniref:Uncharacterized protein n=2 Tax=Mycoplasmopsis pullorum TaxID=48003 RepID=A0A1L4FSJ7_9BACT|nr:hypothetical protein BLA55_02750 [Mycoplasmopsis pullorum]